MLPPGFQIGQMRPRDVMVLDSWATTEGWNPGLDDAAPFHAQDPSGFLMGWLGAAALIFAPLLVLVGAYAPAAFLSHFTVFVLACFVGYMVVWNVKPALHTPLMSVTNAISSIIAIGALVQISPMAAAGRPNTLIAILAALALVLTAINMFGGFAVTQRMLAMFRK